MTDTDMLYMSKGISSLACCMVRLANDMILRGEY